MRFYKIISKNKSVRNFYNYLATRWLLSSFTFLPDSIRAHSLRLYLMKLPYKEKKQKLNYLIRSRKISKYFSLDIFSVFTQEIYKSFKKKDIEKRIIPVLSNKIENSLNLNGREKEYNLLMIGSIEKCKNNYQKRVLRKPDFIIGGTQKAGSSWLKKAINNHPEVWMPPIELHYFSNNIRDWSFDDYCRIFMVSEKKYVGEKSTTYLPFVDKMIDQLDNNTKIIFILRDPFDRIVSHYFHVMKYNIEKKISIYNFICNNVNRCIDYGMYYKYLYKYFNKIFVVFFEDIKSKPDLVIKQVSEYLNLPLFDSKKMVPKGIVNKGEKTSNFNYKGYLRVNNLEDFLRKVYINDIQNLERISSRDLTAWREW
jgi:hypothetical protein